MDKPVRIQRSRQHKQVSQNGLPVVYVGRPSRFGNPFRVGYKGLTAQDAVDIFKIIAYKIPEKELAKIRGKNLSCWCKIGEPCHADILLELANQYPMDKGDKVIYTKEMKGLPKDSIGIIINNPFFNH